MSASITTSVTIDLTDITVLVAQDGETHLLTGDPIALADGPDAVEATLEDLAGAYGCEVTDLSVIGVEFTDPASQDEPVTLDAEQLRAATWNLGHLAMDNWLPSTSKLGTIAELAENGATLMVPVYDQN